MRTRNRYMLADVRINAMPLYHDGLSAEEFAKSVVEESKHTAERLRFRDARIVEFDEEN